MERPHLHSCYVDRLDGRIDLSRLFESCVVVHPGHWLAVDPFSDTFFFRNCRVSALKILYHDGQVLWLITRLLSQ